MPRELEFDHDRLFQFERTLNIRHPEKSAIPTRVLGHGEISTALETDLLPGLALKRMPMFQDLAELQRYQKLYWEYLSVLQEQVGLALPLSASVQIPPARGQRIVLYIVQEKQPEYAIGNRMLHTLSAESISRLVQSILNESGKVFKFNQLNRGKIELGFDNQVSNWAVKNYSPAQATLPELIDLCYIDTSTPLMRKDNREQLNPELFLRSAPSFLRWILRLFFLDDVMTRYYDPRKTIMDLIGNFYKEQRDDLVEETIAISNRFLDQSKFDSNHVPILPDEIQKFYRQDAQIWRFYLAFRKVDRFIYQTLHKPYPYILPEYVKR